ncbi:unnamed protein product [Caenorhabditis angaria]|uniref:SCP2 domain-containing protein n=1 Tax=Caenorhabditis angaria TaxID=860376 RepID=A0A9P1J4R1_9PELO|nr:unnamed protein product [Caenorhabditis angaria]
MSFKSDVVFNKIKEIIRTDKDLVRKVGTSFRINVAGPNGTVKTWTIVAKSDNPYIGDDKSRVVDIEININDSDVVSIATGQLKADEAFKQGKIKLKGNIAKIMQLRNTLDPNMLKL